MLSDAMWTHVIIILFASLVVGLILQRIVLVQLRTLAKKTPWKGVDLVIESIRGPIILWCLLLGMYYALRFAVSIDPVTTEFIKKVLFVVTVFSVTALFAHLVVRFIEQSAARVKHFFPATSLLIHVSRFLIFLIGALIVMASLGIQITPILTALGIGGLAVALALRDTLENGFAGLHIVLSKLVRPGDYIHLDGGQEGRVQDISWRNTTIKDKANSIVVIPNAKLASSIVTNYTLSSKGVAITLDIRVGYTNDLERVEHTILSTVHTLLKAHADVQVAAEPSVRFHTFDSATINGTIIIPVKEFHHHILLKHELIKQLHARFTQEQIEFK